MEESDVKLTKTGQPDKRTGKDGSSRKNVSRAREKINTLVRAGKLVQEDDSSDLEITIHKKAPVASKRKPLPEPRDRTPSPSPINENYNTLVAELAALRKDLSELRTAKPESAPDPVATIRRQILMRF